MPYGNEISIISEILNKLDIPNGTVSTRFFPADIIGKELSDNSFCIGTETFENNTVYVLRFSQCIGYIILKLPDEKDCLFFIGPYKRTEKNNEKSLTQNSEFSYRNSNVFNTERFLFAAADTLAKNIYKDEYTFEVINTGAYRSPLIQKAMIRIENDLSGDLSLKNLSKIGNVSSSYFSLLFKKETGQTLTDYVNGKRVEHAKFLLATTDLQIQTVAQQCGILDLHYFCRVFKKIVKKTPTQYRRENKLFNIV